MLTGGQVVLDLTDLAFTAATAVTFTADAGGHSGVLTVSDGQHMASIAMLGDYVGSDFHIEQDGTGTRITYLHTADLLV